MRATLFLENQHFKPVNIKVWQPQTLPDCRGNSTKQPNFKKKRSKDKVLHGNNAREQFDKKQAHNSVHYLQYHKTNHQSHAITHFSQIVDSQK